MKSSNKIIGYIALVGIIATLTVMTSGCSFTKKEKDIYERTPADLLVESQKKLDKYEYQSAAKLLQAIKDRYPYSAESIIAELKLADSYFQRKEYDSALSCYDEFERLHPKDKQIPYIMYQKGMCHFLQITSIDRDQTYTINAREEFEKLIKRFPENDYAGKARGKVRECIAYQAEYELYVGHFYYKMGKYQPAMERFTYLIENYPDVGQYQEAIEYIARCKIKLAGAEKDQSKP